MTGRTEQHFCHVSMWSARICSSCVCVFLPLSVAVTTCPTSAPQTSFLQAAILHARPSYLNFAGVCVSTYTGIQINPQTRDHWCTLFPRGKASFLLYAYNWLPLALPVSILEWGGALSPFFCTSQGKGMTSPPGEYSTGGSQSVSAVEGLMAPLSCLWGRQFFLAPFKALSKINYRANFISFPKFHLPLQQCRRCLCADCAFHSAQPEANKTRTFLPSLFETLF